MTRALEIIRKELDISMALCGERDLDNIGPEHLLIPRDFLDEYQIGQPA